MRPQVWPEFFSTKSTPLGDTGCPDFMDQFLAIVLACRVTREMTLDLPHFEKPGTTRNHGESNGSGTCDAACGSGCLAIMPLVATAIAAPAAYHLVMVDPFAHKIQYTNPKFAMHS